MRLFQLLKEIITLVFKIRPWRSNYLNDPNNVIEIRQTIERLGSVFIKFGQMLALRPDIIPDTLCKELYALLDRVPSFGVDQVKLILEKELQSPIENIFDNFGWTPIASASFSQVHKAKLKNGKTVAIKIQRPGIQQLVNKDIWILYLITNFVDMIFQPTNKVTNLVHEFSDWTHEELDYNLEINNIQRFSELSKEVNADIRGPIVYESLCTQKIIVMEFIEGKSLAQIITDKQNPKPFDGKEITRRLISHALEMCHIHGYFHADPHPANIIYSPTDELVYVDFGIMGSLTKKERVTLLRYFRSMLASDTNEAFTALSSLCQVPSSVNREQVKIEYNRLAQKIENTFQSKTYLEQQKLSGPILTDILKLFQKNGFQLPISIVRYFKMFETMEGLVFALYPNLQATEMLTEFKNVTTLNLVNSLVDIFDEKNLGQIMTKLVNTIEKSLADN